jgi:hypothetical protein
MKVITVLYYSLWFTCFYLKLNMHTYIIIFFRYGCCMESFQIVFLRLIHCFLNWSACYLRHIGSSFVLFCALFFDTGSHYVAQAVLHLVILLSAAIAGVHHHAQLIASSIMNTSQFFVYTLHVWIWATASIFAMNDIAAIKLLTMSMGGYVKMCLWDVHLGMSLLIHLLCDVQIY